MRIVLIPSPKGRWQSIVPFVFVLLAGAPLLSAATLVHDFYLPMPEAQIRSTFTTLASGVGTNLDSVFSVVITGEGTVIHYDQWEDGYETDLAHPTQPSTKVWGDGNDANGIPPGYANDPSALPAGTVLTLRNLVPLPRNPANLLFDGRDRMAATKALVVSRAAWATTPGTVLAGAVEVTATIDYGTSYVSPVGQDLTNGLFQYVGLFVMASADNTAVTVDLDGPGAAPPTMVVLNRGESYLVNGGVKKGASVNATKPVQVNLVIGHVGARYATDWFTLYPTNQWDDTYITPVSTANNGNATYVYFYNPGSSNLNLTYTTRTGNGNLTVASNGVTQYLMPQSSGARFTSTNGQKFFALSTAGANPSSDAAYDWGFTLLPESGLTTEAVVGWGPGSSDGSVNGSPVWVTPLAATRVYVDYNGDRAGALTDPRGNKYDAAYDLAALESRRIYDPDKNQTAMRLYTLDGTLISTAWGEDPDVASPGNPYLDFGTTVLPFPVPVLKKSSTIFTDNNSPGLSVGDVLEYTIQLDNHGLLPLGNTVVVDTFATNLTYVPASTKLDGVTIPDSASGTLFPLDVTGYTIPVILRGGMTLITYRATINASGAISNFVSALGYNLAAQNVLAPPLGGTTQCGLTFTDSTGTNIAAAYPAGGNVYVRLSDADKNSSSATIETISVTVQNAARNDLQTITLTETSANSGVFRNAGGLPLSPATGLAQQDGTLNVAPGDVLSVAFTDASYGDTCNASAVIQTNALTKVLYLSGTNATDLNLDRVDPVAAADVTTASSTNLGSGSGSAIIGAASTSTGFTNSATSISFSHTPGAGPNRLLVVAIGAGATSATDNVAGSVTNVTFGGVALTRVASITNSVVISFIYSLTNPATGPANIVIQANAAASIAAGATTFTNVNQSTPFGAAATSSAASGTTSSVIVSSATNELVFSTANWDFGTVPQVLTPGAGQTALWSGTNAVNIGVAASTKPGAASVTNTYTAANSQQWSTAAVPIKPATGGSGGTNLLVFTQTPGFCQNFTLPTGGLITVTNFITLVSGSMPVNPAITATLRYGATTFATLSNPTYNSSASNLVWSGVVSSNITIPAGAAITFLLSNAQSSVSYRVDFDSTTKPSKITLPTTTVIDVSSLGVYSAPYPGGGLMTTPFSGQTLYVRASVNDPFGSYDISSVNLALDGPGGAGDLNVTLTNSTVVANDGCTKIYEYVWQTGATVGGYSIAATANEGTEGISDVAATSVLLTFLDTGTPGTADFTSGNNGTSTNAFVGNGTICVRVMDSDENANSSIAETLTAVVTSSSGDSESVTLTETATNSGVFTACVPASTNSGAGTNSGTLNAPVSSVLVVTYTDPNDGGDQSSATGTVIPAAGTTRVTMSKTLVTPGDGQAGIGETIQYNLQVVNSGSTMLTNISITDTFPSNRLAFVSASRAPNTIAGGTLTWTNIGPLVIGASTNILVTFTATSATNSAVNSAVANAGGGITNFSSVGVKITHAALSITKTMLTPTNSPVSISSNITFRILVQNTGDTPIPSVPLEDTFSASCYEYVSATLPPDGIGAGALLWNDITGAGSLATNASLTIDVTLKVTGGCDPANNTAKSEYAVDANGDPVPTATSTVGTTTAAARITGAVYDDKDKSGTLTAGDAGLDGVTLELFTDPDGDGNPADGALVQLVTTTSGVYELLNLTTGRYVVVEIDLPGYTSSAPANNRIAINFTTLTTNANNNFFDYQPSPTNYATIGGSVWNDANSNGVKDVSETGLTNVPVDLVQDVNTNGFADVGEPVVASTATATNGAYSFANVIAGTYVVRETDLFGYASTGDSRPPNDNQIGVLAGAGATTNGNDFLDFFTGNTPGNDAPVATNDVYTTVEDTTLTVPMSGVLTNDSDLDGDPLTAVLVSSPAHGALTLNANGSFTYTPTNNYSGPDSFTYRASDGTTNSGIATANITVTAVNDAPVANNDSYTTPEDTTLNVPGSGVLTNDTDVENDALTAVLVTGPTHGALTLNTNGGFTYTPTNNYSGPDSFTYRANDGSSNSSIASASITVNPINDAPLALNDVTNILEDASVTITPLVNDSDVDGNPLTITNAVTTNGIVSIIGGTNLVFTPATNFNGTVILSYTITDGTTNASALITVTVTPANDTPVAVNDSISTSEDVAVTIPVLVNDNDPDSDPLSIVSAITTNGSVNVVGTNLVFIPATNFNGTVTLTYTITDGVTNASALVTITVTPINDAPVAFDDSYSLFKNATLNVPLSGVLTNDSDADGNPLVALLATGVAHGNLTLSSNGGFIYTPVSNYVGSDSFTYRANDGTTNSSLATVDLTITATNTAPVANSDNYSTAEDTALTVPTSGVLTNDTDIDGDSLTAVLVANPIHGTLTLNPNGGFTYTPTNNYNGADSFTYRANDGLTNSGIATVSLTITPVNDAPVALNDVTNMLEDVSVTICPLTNDFDVDGDALTITNAVTTNGVVVIAGGTNLVFTPATNFNGTVTLSYTITDGTTNASAFVTVTITPVNDAPVAVNDAASTPEDVAVTIPVLVNDSDVDGNPLSIVSAGTTNGSVNVVGTNLVFTPATNFNGAVTLSYTITDGTTNASALVTVTVTAVNDAPVASNDSYITVEDATLKVPVSGVLTNDADVDGNPLTAALVTGPAHGTITLNPNGNFTYTPTNNYNGPDSFTYRANDGITNSGIATASITVTPVNDAPVAVNDAASTPEDVPVIVPVLMNDSDPDSDSLSIVSAVTTNGSVNVVGTNLVFTPATNFNGTVTLSYTITDGTTNASALVTVTVTPVNDAPVAVNDAVSTPEDVAVTIPVLVNDSDPDSDPLSIVSAIATNGSVNVVGTNLVFTPATNFNGTITLSYTITDGTTNASALVTVTITGVNDAPIANNDSYTTAEDTTLNIPVSGVLTNDTDVDGNPLTTVIVTGPIHGSLTLNANGSFTYTPTNNYNGPDSFTYRANDGATNSNIATTSITVTPVNDAPVAINDTATTPEDVAVTIPVLINDNDPDSDPLSIVSAITTNGSVNVVGTNLVFTPATNFNGTVTFTYTITDGTTNASALVTVAVTSVNDTPIASNDAFSLFKNTTLTLPAAGVLTNDFDADGNPLVALLASSVTHGTLTLSSNGGFIYTPVSNYVGSDSFTYRANDGTTNSGLATVSLIIAATNTAPVAANDGYTTAEDTALTVLTSGVLTNDTDVDGDSLTAVLVANPIHGALALNSNGGFLYTPTNNYNGADSFTYRVNDGLTNSGIATVNLTITPVNDAPVAVNDVTNTLEDVAVTIRPLTNDFDVDGDTLTITNAVTTNGFVTIIGGTNLVFTPATNFNGTATINYTITDGTNTATALITVTVTAVNDVPVANNDSYTTAEDIVLNIPASGVLTNDADVDGNTLTAVLATGPAHGTLALNPNGGFLYTPTNNYNGPDSFTYRASDGTTNSGITTASITVTPVNDAPVAVNDSATTPEDVTVTIPVLANDSDPDSDPLSIVSAVTTNGSVNVVGTNLVFTPATNFNGTVTFTYTITDGTTNASALVTVAVTSVNDTPIASNDAFSLFKNTTLTLPAAGVLTNDFDADGNPLVALLATGVAHGALTLSSNGGFAYTPVSNYVGSDSFTYRANDGTTNSGLATVNLTIAATNSAPVAMDDTYPVFSTAQLIVNAPGVLTNDTDADGDALTAALASAPSHGTVTLNANGSFTYTPTNNYTGPDSFTYSANDGFANSSIATVNVTVSPRADVVLVKTGAPSGAAGSNMTFTITVTNSGPSTASNVVVFDQLPVAYTFVSAVPVAASVSNNLVRWPATNLPNGSSAVFTVTATSTSGGVFTNIAYSTSSTVDLNSTNNDGSSTNSQVVSTMQAVADVAVFKTGSGSVVAGGSVNYTITVTNRGPSAATNVIVRDTLPAGVTLQSASSGFSLNNGVVSWTIANLANGATSNYTVTVSAPASGNLTNIASAMSGTSDPTPGNNDGSSASSQASTTITPMADVVVSKTGATNVGSGATFTYTITVTNRGPSAASSIIVRDLLPTNLVFVSASAGGGFASNTVTWPAIASLPNGGATNYTLTVTAPLTGSFTNKVTSTAATADSDMSNNDGSTSGSQVITAVIAGQFAILSGPIVFNPQTGLFEQQATVTNTSGATVAGVRLLVGNIRGTNGVPRTNVFLYNASGTNADPRPYVQYNSPLNPGATVTFMLEFYVPDRKPFTNTLEAEAFIPLPGGTNAGAGVLIDRTFMDLRIAGSPRFVIEWASVPGRTYTIIYSDTGTAPWFVATPSVTANANRTQWYDDGPPKTASNPMSIPSRFYRVIVAP